MLQGPKLKSEQDIINIRVNSDIDSYISESDAESQVSVESLELPVDVNLEDDLNQLMTARLHANRVYLDEEADAWEFLEPDNATTFGAIQIVKKPTASQMMHLVLNPFLYRSLQPIDSLDALAAIVGAPTNWLDIAEEKVLNNPIIRRLYRVLTSIDFSGSESAIQDSFDVLVAQIGSCLGITVQYIHNQSFIVGGVLARSKYDIRGRSNTIFKGWSGNALLATECKKASAFPVDKLWHHGSRGIQTISTMYRSGCPTILYSQKAFKVFVDNESRDAIHTWPFGDSDSADNREPYSRQMVAHSYSVQQMTSVILSVISICLLACGDDDRDSSLEDDLGLMQTPSKSFEYQSNVVSTGKQVGNKRKRDGMDDDKKVSRAQKLSLTQPKFASGFDDGVPVYTYVRVMPDDRVSVLEQLFIDVDKNSC
ncbi:hypothetical protein MIR68_011605 [Amoeboaphelidium protococcarum]|nr:hypothetical protein MIR68_011605 [Amoeboaphelidium protococcarum]